MFKLSEEEVEIMVSQNAIPSKRRQDQQVKLEKKRTLPKERKIS